MERYTPARWSRPSAPFDEAKACSVSYFQNDPAHSFAPISRAPFTAAATWSLPSSRRRIFGSGCMRVYRNGPWAIPRYSGFRRDVFATFTSRSTASSAFVRSLISLATTRFSWTKNTDAVLSRQRLLMTGSFRAKRIWYDRFARSEEHTSEL